MRKRSRPAAPSAKKKKKHVINVLEVNGYPKRFIFDAIKEKKDVKKSALAEHNVKTKHEIAWESGTILLVRELV